jgi:tRNA A37 threonylcarbamoyladenosine synthetase subunit TsaC/SUA5/YrdC
MLTTTLRLPDDELPLNDAREIRERLQRDIDAVVDGGPCGLESTTVVDLVDDVPRLIRVGKGDPTLFE